MFKKMMAAVHNTLVGIENRRKQLAVAAVALFPLVAHADWWDTAKQYADQFQKGLYLLAFAIFVCCATWGSIRLVIARVTNSHDYSWTDLGTAILYGAIAGAVPAACAWAWQFFGGTM